MKYRILGAFVIVVILILVALFGKSLVFPDSGPDTQRPTQSQPDNGFKL
jgi:hypothetical protein